MTLHDIYIFSIKKDINIEVLNWRGPLKRPILNQNKTL
jgi:hypothetical protein